MIQRKTKREVSKLRSLIQLPYVYFVWNIKGFPYDDVLRLVCSNFIIAYKFQICMRRRWTVGNENTEHNKYGFYIIRI